jgi:translation initiation factor 2 subunit 2
METYSDQFLLDKLYEELEAFSPSIKKLSIERPEVTSANKKTFVVNFRNICSKLNRTEAEIKQFFENELKTTVTINMDGALVITGNYKQNGIMSILTSYLKEFVICRQCSSCDTILKKENKIMFLVCSKCLSEHAIMN